jgi:hypothetical protein
VPGGPRRIVDLVGELTGRRRPGPGPFLLAIDGRSSAGKSTLAGRIAGLVPRSAIVHTDDLAWWHSRFGWDDLLIAGVVTPLRRGEAVEYRPPAWEARRRPGSITVPAGADLVVIEGVGSGRASLAGHVDAVIWVDAAPDVADGRDRMRLAAGELDAATYVGWMAEEIPFLAGDRPWERADVVVSGTAAVADPGSDIVVLGSAATRPPGRSRPGA